MRTHSVSKGGTTTWPPSSAARSAVASASSTENVIPQCGGTSSENCSLDIGTIQATVSSNPSGASQSARRVRSSGSRPARWSP